MSAHTEEEVQALLALVKQQAEERERREAAINGQPMTVKDDNAVTPLDLLTSDNYTTKAVRNERMKACRSCDDLFKPTRMCRHCGCFMAAKTWLKEASCPLEKWEAVP